MTEEIYGAWTKSEIEQIMRLCFQAGARWNDLVQTGVDGLDEDAFIQGVFDAVLLAWAESVE